MRQDISQDYKWKTSIRPQAATGNITGVAVDCQEGGAEVPVLTLIGDIGGGTTIDVKLQESADGSTGWADMTGAAQAQITDASQDDVVYADTFFHRTQRYVRAVATFGGASADSDIAVAVGVRKIQQ